jgi:hypothetical protein
MGTDTARLEQLGLRVESDGEGVQATLELEAGAAPVNPITRRPLPHVTFRLSGNQLVPAAPPAVVGLAPILLEAVATREELARLLTTAFDEYLFHVERRSAQLHALGLHPRVEPETLGLSAELDTGPLSFTLVADRQGLFQVGQVRREGAVLGGVAHRFELSEFREREALASYLTALVEEPSGRPQPAAPAGLGLVRYAELVEAFGPQALLPPRSPLEVLVQLSVGGETYRFATARLVGRTFRGLLAGAKGKVWAGRFELDDFPGIVRWVAGLLGVPPEAVKLVGPDKPQE